MQLTSDRYELGEPLGAGGFGDVYRATRKHDGAAVAIKVLREPQQRDFRDRFGREAGLLKSYNHPGIVKVLDADVDGPQPFYVMPLYRDTLRARIGKLSGEEFYRILRSVVSALTFLHERGAFHRDLKPDNVLLDDSGDAVLCDFGLANDPELTTAFTRGGAGGTEGYMAPELGARRNAASPKSDIYALGATAFFMLTGIHPAEAPREEIEGRLAQFPDEIAAKILQMLDFEPRRRPGAGELWQWLKARPRRIIDSIEKALCQKIVQPIRGARRAVRAVPWWPLFILVGLIVVVVVGTVLLLRGRRRGVASAA